MRAVHVRAGSVAMHDERQRRAELEEGARIRRHGLEVAQTAADVAAKVDRMNRIYRERLVGNRQGGAS